MYIRKIKEGDLDQLLSLYKHLHHKDVCPKREHLEKAWKTVLDNEYFHYFVFEEEGRILSTCNLSIVPNFTRGARPFGLIENVVTHTDYRRQGLGRKMIAHTIAFAKTYNCYKIMLLSSVDRKESHEFYNTFGFSASKSGFVLRL